MNHRKDYLGKHHQKYDVNAVTVVSNITITTFKRNSHVGF